MESARFDGLVTALSQNASRRRTLLTLAAMAVGVGGSALLSNQDAAAKKRKNKKRKKRCKPLASGARCTSDKACCTKKTKRICDVPQNASNSDTKCCGGAGAPCGGVNEDGDAQPPFCCIGEAGVRAFQCSESDEANPGVPGTCIPSAEN